MGAVLERFRNTIGEAIGKAFEQAIADAVEKCRNTTHPIGMAFQGISEAAADPLFERYLSLNSSQHLDYHYASVRDSLTPVQLTGFDQSLQTSLGGSGTVVFGGVGVVALALAMLFDVLATKAKGQTAPPDPIKQVFHGEDETLWSMRSCISDCLLRLPKSGNYEEKMLDETRLCSSQLKRNIQNYTSVVLERAQATSHRVSDTERIHLFNAHLFYLHLGIHLKRLSKMNSSEVDTLLPIDGKQEQMPLLLVFAPNVTYAMQHWNNSEFEQLCTSPMITFFLFSVFSNESQNAYAYTLKDLDKLRKQQEKFVVFK